MLSSIETLANELLDLILQDLNLAEQTALLRCSKYLRQRIEPALYEQESQRDVAMHWAIQNGKTHIIRLLVSYGASIDTFSGHGGSPHPSLGWSPNSTLLFAVAAKEKSTDAFELLLELGAKVPKGRGDIPTFDLVVQQDASIDLREDTIYHYRDALNIPVFAAVYRMAMSIDMLQRCLDLGGDINTLCVYSHFIHGKTTPLSHYLDSNRAVWWRDRGLHPVDGIKFILEHHAELPTAGQSIVSYLLQTQGARKLKHPRFLETLKFMIEHGEFDQYGSEILSDQYRDDRFTAQWKILEALILHLRNTGGQEAASKQPCSHCHLVKDSNGVE
ncbi:hypothetical protein HYFRA_00005862 [Hymenoscyphus fraxineus]|uniref:Ankyrin n=1 Tax=Hymenoscyphus fraxineus TaxID=746836 RepID=A0A9N9KYC8_9HELO|nr:hypothetical protein HYFRA_00005862 [Hymenoscyphus fraxineus]